MAVSFDLKRIISLRNGALAAALVLGVSGLYLILSPVVVHWQQDRLSDALEASYDAGVGIIELGAGDWAVSGEEADTLVTGQPTESASAPAVQLADSAANPTAPVAPVTNQTVPSDSQEKVQVLAIGKIRIPKIELSMPIAEGATDVSLRVAIGHYTPSVATGEVGQSILLGHRMYTKGRFFNRLDELVVDDTFDIETRTECQTYQVTQVETILPEDLGAVFARDYLEPQVLLVTCTPVRVATHRLLVTARLVSRTPINSRS